MIGTCEAAFVEWYRGLSDSDNPHAFTDVGLLDAFTAGWDARGNDWQRSDAEPVAAEPRITLIDIYDLFHHAAFLLASHRTPDDEELNAMFSALAKFRLMVPALQDLAVEHAIRAYQETP